MTRFMLDTNVVGHVMQGRDAALLARLTKLPMGHDAKRHLG